jgi:NAD(P)-binding Rossmann-like domain
MAKINIIGAGMAGLLAANMLRRHNITVYEKQPELPNNHHAVLRFRTPEVGNVLGIPFKKVNMIKTYVPWGNVVSDTLSYSKKVTGKYLSDRSITAGTTIAERYIAPPNLIQEMARNVNVEYNMYDFDAEAPKHPTISTIPMPLLMAFLHYKNDLLFDKIPGSVLSATIEDCDAYVSVLFPGPNRFSRATITGDQLIVEFPNIKKINPNDFELNRIVTELGIAAAKITDIQFKKQEYFKIVEIDNAERKKFQRWATVHHNIFSLGRYATWRPKLLLDDLVSDIKKIEGWIVSVEQ